MKHLLAAPWQQTLHKEDTDVLAATRLIHCSHLWSISPPILYEIENLVHHIARKGWHAAWAVCKGTGGASRRLHARL